jgi:predicted enzyme related to lactoylglutathione lyase
MTDTVGTTTERPSWEDRPIWIDLSSGDAAGSRAFYARLLGWQIEVNPDPLYGGYALASVEGGPVAGIGPKMMAEAPTAWSLYIGTTDVDALAERIRAAGGTVVAPPMTVGDQGRMGVFQDPSGAFFGAWQPMAMAGFVTGRVGAYQWADLNARGFERAAAFYGAVFGWTSHPIPMGEGQPLYAHFALGEEMIAGGMEMNPMAPAGFPSYWMVYFSVPNVEDAFQTALAAGATEMMGPTPFPGGRFAILSDPQGAVFALHEAGAR